jgi:hypothetical protein
MLTGERIMTPSFSLEAPSRQNFVLGLVFLLILLGGQTLVAGEDEYEQGIDGARVWFISHVGSQWVDLQTRLDGQGIVGYRMTATGDDRHEYLLPDLTQGDVIEYRFIYQSDADGQRETPWGRYICADCAVGDPPNPEGEEYEQGIDGALAWFVSNVGSQWVDVQTRRDGQGIVGYRMTAAGDDRHEYSLPNLAQGDVIEYRFIYQNDARGQSETPWVTYVCGDCTVGDPPDPEGEEYEQGIDGALAWFVSNVGSQWVDVQTRRDGHGIVGYRMTATGDDRHEYSLPDLNSGDLFEYRFIYQSDARGQVETPWFLYQDDGSEPDDPVTLLELQPGMEMTIQFENNTEGAYTDGEIYICIIARNEAHRFSYLRPDGAMIEIGPGEHSDAWSYRLSEIDGFQVPQWAESGRLYLSMGRPVEMISILEDATGLVGIVQPNLHDPNDPNQEIFFEWMEFTVQPGAFWGNTTQVDQYSFSYTLQLYEDSGRSFRAAQKVGIEATRGEIFALYEDWAPAEFSALVERPYRIVAPAKGVFGRDQAYATYMDAYTDAVWNHYRWNRLTYTHPIWGTFEGRVLNDDRFQFRREADSSSYWISRKPDTQELFECSGVMATGNPIELALQAQVCAALNRHVATDVSQWRIPAAYYSAAPSNYYAAFWHQVNLSGLAYGFSYDDVAEQAPLIENHAPRGLVIDIKW